MKKKTAPQGVTGLPNTAHAGSADHPSDTVKLPADLGIEQAAALHAQLRQHVARDGTVTLDASDIQRIHTAALQLFCMFCRDRRSAGRETQWRQPSAALRSASALLGATTLLAFGQA